MNVLVTGAAGYIGSHACKRLLAAGHSVVGVDNLFRGHPEPMDMLRADRPDLFRFVRADVADKDVLVELMRPEGGDSAHRIDAVMHFAAFAYVGESVDRPMDYYRNNVGGMISLLEACRETGVGRFVFSSSCATYGQPPDDLIPVPETCPQNPMSPYGYTKLIGERLLLDHAESEKRRADAGEAGRGFRFVALRYFNVAGCDLTGRLGEDHDPETHLIPVVLQAAMGLRSHVSVFGDDYPTPDGTCIRDYIHVDDLCDAHIAALGSLASSGAGEETGRFYNLGIGRGYSVKEVIESARRVTGKPIEVKITPRRAGDPPQLFAAPAKIHDELGWSARVTSLDDIVASAWKWFRDHPRGYRG
jgi:UDP-glucose-4-epimerase GalE